MIQKYGDSATTLLRNLLHNHSKLFPQKRDLLAKHELRLDEATSVEVMMNIGADAQRFT